MQVSKNFNLIGQVQLYMKFWPIGHPETGYYMTFNMEFSKPITRDALFCMLKAAGQYCERESGTEMMGEYISESQYAKECTAHDKAFAHKTYSWDDTSEL